MKIPSARSGKVGAFSSLGAVIVVSLALLAPSSRAQDLDSSLESELDALSASTPSSEDEFAPLPTATPSAQAKKKKQNGSEEPSAESDDFADESPLPDPFGDSDLQPLESSTAPPEKSQRAAKTESPLRTEPEESTEPVPADPPKSANSLAPSSDEPNEAFEARMAAIYAQNSEPISDEKWSGLLGSRAAENYSIQAGDTLWDLSSTLFADGFYWSKLWAENPEIQNPHQIAKGQAIRFIGGTEAAPPEIRVVKDEPDELTVQTQAAFEKEDVVPAMQEVKTEDLIDIDLPTARNSPPRPNRVLNQAPYYQEDIEGKITQADLESGIVIEQSELIPRPILPPPSQQRRALLRDIPLSFREYKPRNYKRTVTIQRRNRDAEKVPGAVVPGYMAFENVPEPMGTVDEVDEGALIASIGQYVYVRGNEPLAIGSRMYTVTPRFDVKSRSGRIGSAVEVGGVIRVLERVDEKANLYRAQVVYIVNPVRVNSLVLVGDLPRIPVTTAGRRLTTELAIAGGAYSDSRRFFGDGSVVFLDTQESGVRVGDVLAVQARRGERKQTIAPDQITPIGILKVFAVSGKIASAMVVLATEEIRVGDRTGATFPRRMPDLRIEAPRLTRASE
jgi:hypothetical protein